MANPEHLALLQQRVQRWNQWRKKHLDIICDLSKAHLFKSDLVMADLRRTNLSGADLSWANLSGADLCESNLSGADLTGADLSDADLSDANLTGADLSRADLTRADLTRADLTRANLTGANLTGANFTGANFTGADLTGADLSGFDLNGANLTGANLSKTQVLGTNFTNTIFTGACLEDWNINSATRLDNVVCQYVYLKANQQERRPSSGEFEPGEFTKLFQKALNTIDLIFRNGVDWEAFAYSFRKIQVEHAGEELVIQSIENKGDGMVVVRVNVSPNADKPKIDSDFMQGYEFAHNFLNQEVQRQQNVINNLFLLLNQQLSQQQTFQRLLAENPPRIINIDSGNYNESIAGNYIQGDYINMSQDWSAAATQLQELLNQLQNRGATVEVAQEQVANDMATQAKSNPGVMGKLVKWGQSLGDTAAKTTVSEATKATLKLALTILGIPLP